MTEQEGSINERTMMFIDNDTEVEYMRYIVSSNLSNFLAIVRKNMCICVILALVCLGCGVAQGNPTIDFFGIALRTAIPCLVYYYMLAKLTDRKVSYVKVEYVITTSWIIGGLCLILLNNFQLVAQDTCPPAFVMFGPPSGDDEVSAGGGGATAAAVERSPLCYRLWLIYMFRGNTALVLFGLLVACHGIVRYSTFKYFFGVVQGAHIFRFTFVTPVPPDIWVMYFMRSTWITFCAIVTFKVMERNHRKVFVLMRQLGSQAKQLERELGEAKEALRLEEPTDRETSVVRQAFAELGDGGLEHELKGVRQVAFDELVLEERIGTGSYGEVIQATYLGARVAVKRLLRNRIEPQYLTAFVKEVILLQMLSHPNIVQFIGASWDNAANVCSVTELVERGSLHSVLQADANSPTRRLTWFEPKLRMAIDTACGLSYLHNYSPSIIHRDMKPENILVTDTYLCKLTDFGVAREAVRSEAMTITGTPKYVAPEVLLGKAYDERVDIFSFGMCLLAMHLHDDPWTGLSMEPIKLSAAEVQCRVAGGERPELPFDLPAELVPIIHQCWSQTPSDRPSAVELMALLKRAHGAVHPALPPVNVEAVETTDDKINRRYMMGAVGGAEEDQTMGSGWDDMGRPWHPPTVPADDGETRQVLVSGKAVRRRRAAPRILAPILEEEEGTASKGGIILDPPADDEVTESTTSTEGSACSI